MFVVVIFHLFTFLFGPCGVMVKAMDCGIVDASSNSSRAIPFTFVQIIILMTFAVEVTSYN